jgi:hypothetical protein
VLQDWEPVELEQLLALFNAASKSEVEKVARTLTIHQSDLVGLILACQAGGMPPLKYACSFSQRHPEHLVPTQTEKEALSRNGVGPLQGKARKMISKSFQMFEERRVLASHLFYSPDRQFWHALYFDQRDIEERGNHWKHGAHIHYTCDLFHNLSLADAWARICEGSGSSLKPIHVRFRSPDAAA